MVSRNALRSALATLMLLGARSVSAGPIDYTGFVENDFNPADKNIKVIQVDPDPLNRIVQLPQMTAQGIINGYALKDIRMSYDFDSDTMYVGLNTYSIAGSAIGNGGPDLAALLASQGGQDPANIGGRKSISLGFAGVNRNDLSTRGENIMVAGVPADKALAGPGLNGFTVSTMKSNPNVAVQHSYGSLLANQMGDLAFNPSAAHPGFEFTIKNFSKVSSNLNPEEGFWVNAYLGSPDDLGIGEEGSGWIKIPAFEKQVVPEPTTWLAWTAVLASAGAYRLRRRSR